MGVDGRKPEMNSQFEDAVDESEGEETRQTHKSMPVQNCLKPFGDGPLPRQTVRDVRAIEEEKKRGKWGVLRRINKNWPSDFLFRVIFVGDNCQIMAVNCLQEGLFWECGESASHSQDQSSPVPELVTH